MRGTGVNKNLLKNSTCIQQEKVLPNNDSLGIQVSSQSFKRDNHFLSFAIEGTRLPEFVIHDQGWQEV